MNKVRRNRIADVQSKLEELKAEIESICKEEQEAYDNMPEQFQDSERGENISEAIESLESAMDSFDELDEYLTDAAGH